MKRKINKILVGIMAFIPLTTVFAYEKVSCGNMGNIAAKIPELTSFIVTAIEIAIPVILVVSGSIDLVKAVTANKEDEMKKAQQLLIKKIIVGAIVFFAIAIVKFLVSLVEDDSENIIECIDCFLSNDCKEAKEKK